MGAEYLGDDRSFDKTQTDTPVCFGNQQTANANVDQALPDISVVGLDCKIPHARQRCRRVQVLVNGVDQQHLFFRETKFHDYFFSACAVMTWGSRGMPRPRSLMMFFCICEVPPPMMRPRKNM